MYNHQNFILENQVQLRQIFKKNINWRKQDEKKWCPKLNWYCLFMKSINLIYQTIIYA